MDNSEFGHFLMILEELVVGVVFVEGELGKGLEMLIKAVFVQTTFVP